ncbi:hypothetical protein FOZ63_023697, partial [Perkinsus olseni]
LWNDWLVHLRNVGCRIVCESGRGVCEIRLQDYLDAYPLIGASGSAGSAFVLGEAFGTNEKAKVSCDRKTRALLSKITVDDLLATRSVTSKVFMKREPGLNRAILPFSFEAGVLSEYINHIFMGAFSGIGGTDVGKGA